MRRSGGPVTTSDYYEPHARLTLPRPVVVLGHPGSGVSAICRAVCGRSGLAFNDVERLVESQAGRSRGRIAYEDGSAHLRALEARVFLQAVARQPLGLVSAGTGLLEDAEVQDGLADSFVVYVQRPDRVLLERLRARRRRAPGAYTECAPEVLENVASLRDWLALREARLCNVHWLLEAGDRHAQALAGEILSALDDLVAASTG